MLNPGEQIMPFAFQGELQSRKRGQARKVFPGLDALDIAGTGVNLLCQFFLRQMPALSKQGNVFAKPASVQISFGFAHRHQQMLAEMCAAKHEALHRVKIVSNLFLYFRRSKELKRDTSMIWKANGTVRGHHKLRLNRIY